MAWINRSLIQISFEISDPKYHWYNECLCDNGIQKVEISALFVSGKASVFVIRISTLHGIYNIIIVSCFSCINVYGMVTLLTLLIANSHVKISTTIF